MSEERSLTVAASLDNLHEVRDFLTSIGRQLKVDPELIMDLHLAVDEAVTNIIMHGFAGRSGTIGISLEREGANIVIRLRDNAPLFDPTATKRVDLAISPLQRDAAGGYGVELIRKMVDELHYQVVDHQNELTLVKKPSNQSI